MKIIVVNEKDEIIGHKERSKTKDDITRVSGLCVYNSKGEILIAQRASSKTFDPGKWGPAAAGTVEEGETYKSNIIKEAKEELGLTIKEKDLKEGKHKLTSSSHRYYRQMFFTKTDLPIKEFAIQKEEVENIQWIAIKELDTWISERPQDFLPSFPKLLEEIKEQLKK